MNYEMLRVFAAFLLLAGVGAKLRFDGHKSVTVYTKSQADVDFLYSLEDEHGFEGLDFWTQPSPVHPTDILVSPKDFDKLRELLSHAGIEFTVTKDNIQVDIDIEEESMRRSRARNTGICDIYNEYCSFEEIEALLEYWYTNHTENIRIITLNQTFEENNIYMVAIHENKDESKPAVIVEAGTHGREWITVSSALVLIQELLSGSPLAQAMLAKYDWYILPVHNPDGYKYTFTTNRLWRKNRQTCYGFGNGVGIDLNRNWDADFGGAGSSSMCSSDLYRGQRAFEAVETAALSNSLQDLRSRTDVVAFFSIHSYSQMMLVPYAFTSMKPANYDHLWYVANEMMNALYEVDQRYFQVGTPPDILYAASGGAYDYFFLQGVPYSYTYELRPATANEGGFVLPPEQILDGTAEFMASIQRFVELDL